MTDTFDPRTSWADLKHLILVAGHGIYRGDKTGGPHAEANWNRKANGSDEIRILIEHIETGVRLAAEDLESFLVFSGGQTYPPAGPKSEAQGYWEVGRDLGWSGHPAVAARATTEEFARDSFENLLFGIARFYECTGRKPSLVTAISWAFKDQRFELHRAAIDFPPSCFKFIGIGYPHDREAARAGEDRTLSQFRVDPYGTGPELGLKRADRNRFRRTPPYRVSCPPLAPLLEHQGPDLWSGEGFWR